MPRINFLLVHILDLHSMGEDQDIANTWQYKK